MSQSRSQSITGGANRRWTSSSQGDRRTAVATSPPVHGPTTMPQSYSRRVASATTNYRDKPKILSRPLSSEQPNPARKTSTNLVSRTEHPPKQSTRNDCTGNRKSPRSHIKRPPFVVGTGNSTVTVYRGSGGCRTYATTKTESRSRSGATSSKDCRVITGCVQKDSGTELTMNKSVNETAISSGTCDVVRRSYDRTETPEVTTTSARFIVADPLPEVVCHRTNRKQHLQSADECIKRAAEKLSEFAAIQSNTSDAKKTDNTTSNVDQCPIIRSDVANKSRSCDVTKSPRPSSFARDGHSAVIQTATTCGGNDVNSASKRVGGTSKKPAEVHRNGSTRLTTACRPSPTRSSLLRQALNCPGSATNQQRDNKRPTKPASGRVNRPTTELATENHFQMPLRQHNVPKQGRVSSAQIPSHDDAAQPTKAKHQASRRYAGDHVAKAVNSTSSAVTHDIRDLAATDDWHLIDAESSRTYNIDCESSEPSSLSTPRTYVVQVLDETDDESSRRTSPRITDRLARRCRRRRPQSRDNGQLPVSPRTRVGYSSYQSSSTETFANANAVSLSSESLRRRHRRSNKTPPGTAVAQSSAPNLLEVCSPPQLRRSSASSEGDVMVSSYTDPVKVQVSTRKDTDDVSTKKSIVSDHHRGSRLPRLVTQPQDTLPSSSSVSPSVVRAPRPRSFRYSRLHRRAVNALVPPQLRDLPWRWAWKASTDIN